MDNLIAFLSSFCSYLIVLVICIAIMVVGALLGIKLRRSKNTKEIVADGESVEAEN